MTVKLAKFFSTNFNVTTPPLPPPKHTGNNSSHNYYHYQPQTQPHPHNNNHHHHQQQQQRDREHDHAHEPLETHQEQHFETGLAKLPHCNLYYDEDDEDDNMSMYSTTASIMTTRDHPFNNSQRPLLPARKPLQLLHNKKLNASNCAVLAMPVVLQQPQSAAQQPRQQKPYISPYVQRQKRDSAKGLHGFNDFGILSQQYNQHLQSPHIGYPYGSPPSPTAMSGDFVFDELTTTAAAAGAPSTAPSAGMHSSALTIKLNQPRYANINNILATNSPTNAYHKVINAIDYCGETKTVTIASQSPYDYMGKSSRFEDDFCSRRNDIFSQKRFDAISNSSGGSSSGGSATGSGSGSGSAGDVGGGPFIFGMPPEQQQGDFASRLPPNNGRELSKSTDTVICSDRDCDRDNYSSAMTLSGKSRMQQSTSDTSSSSQDTTSSSNAACDIKKGARFHLLRKSKSRNKSKTNKPSRERKGQQLPPDEPQKPIIKCVLVGDGAVGKTNLILSYLENRFNPEHVPTASDIYNADVMVNDSPVHLTLCDTAGQDTLDPLRELCYPDSDVFLLCFSVVKPETFDAIKTKWAPKFSKTKAALVLVGTQADLRTSSKVLNKLQTNGEKPISYADAWDLATSIGAKYIETSSATQDKVKEVFDTAIWDGLLPNTLPPTPPFWKKLLCLA